MTYATGTATDQDALFTAIKDFAVTTMSWTQDAFSTASNELEIHKGSVYVQMAWDEINDAAFYQSTGYDGSGPGGEPGDSGNGDLTSPYSTARRINVIGTGPFNYYLFGNTSPDYIHGAIEIATGIYRHFSFGTLIKIGNYTGGEYCSALSWDTADPADIRDFRHLPLWDMLHISDPLECATVHVEGMPNQSGSSIWGVNYTGSSAGNDRDANPRVRLHGHLRDGFLMNAVGWIRANPTNGFIPMFPIHIYYWDATPAPDQYIFLGTVPNFRQINIANMEPKEEFTIGSETWKVFPWVKKANTGSGQETKNMGFAYLK